MHGMVLELLLHVLHYIILKAISKLLVQGVQGVPSIYSVQGIKGVQVSKVSKMSKVKMQILTLRFQASFYVYARTFIFICLTSSFLKFKFEFLCCCAEQMTSGYAVVSQSFNTACVIISTIIAIPAFKGLVL